MGYWKNGSSRVFCSDNDNKYYYHVTNCGEAIVLYPLNGNIVCWDEEIARYSYSAMSEEADERNMYVHQVMAEYFDLSIQAYEINNWLKHKREEHDSELHIAVVHEN